MSTYYVDKNHPSANDGNPGTEGSPWLTIQHAIDTATSPGDIVYVKAGTYQPAATLEMQASGSSGSLITFSNYSIDEVLIDFSLVDGNGWDWTSTFYDYLVIDGFEIINCTGTGITVKGDNNQVNNCTVRDTQSNGIYIIGSNNTIYNNDVYNTGLHGIFVEQYPSLGANGTSASNVISFNKSHNNLYGDGVRLQPGQSETQSTLSSNEVRFNKLYANGGNGIYSRKSSSGIFYNNLIYDNSVYALNFNWRTSADGVISFSADKIYHNTVHNNSSGGIYNTTSQGQLVYNNIFKNNGGFLGFTIILATASIDDGSHDFNYNLYYTNEREDEKIAYTQGKYEYVLRDWQTARDVDWNSHFRDPNFYNEGADDYRLSNNSPAINSATDPFFSSEYDQDIREVSRPQGPGWDIGAYEFIYPAATNYYLDLGATGNATGLSWTNAWKSWPAVNWDLMEPGSILYVSGGVDSKTYSLEELISPTASGITISKGKVSGHNGEVILNNKLENESPAILLSGLNNITIDGFTFSDFIPETGYHGVIEFLNGSYYNFKNCEITANISSAVYASGISNSTFEDLTIDTSIYKNAPTNGIYIVDGNDNTIQDSIITITNYHDTPNLKGIYFSNEENITIDRNKVYLQTSLATQDKSGIYGLDTSGTSKIYNNLVYADGNCTGVGIGFITQVDNNGSAEIYNNTVYVTSGITYPIEIWDYTGAGRDAECKVLNNIFYVNVSGYGASYPVNFDSVSYCDNNLYYNPGGDLIYHVTGANETWAEWTTKGYDDAGYNEAITFYSDYAPHKASVCIDTGQTLLTSVKDVDEVPRPQGLSYDIGAHENRKGYYVDNSIDVSGDGTRWETAWTSFADIDWNLFTPGDSLYISGGDTSNIYQETLNIMASGLLTDPIYIIPGEDDGHNGTVIIDGLNLTLSVGIVDNGYDNVIISGFTFRNHSTRELYVTNADNVKIYDCNLLFYGKGIDLRYGTGYTVSGCYLQSPPFIGSETDGIYSQDNIGCIVEGNQIFMYNTYDAGENDCIELYRDSGTIVRNNYCVQDTGKNHNSRGIFGRDCSGDVRYYNNVVDMKNTQSTAIGYDNLDDGKATLKIYNNTVYGKRTNKALYINSVDDPIVKNNILQSDGATYFIYIDNWNGSYSNIDYNIYWGPQTSNLINFEGTLNNWTDWVTLGFDTNGYNQNPQFINVDTGQLQLQDISPAIDNGISISGFNYDINYVERPQDSGWDIGAYEGTGVDITPPTVVSATILNSTTVEITFSEDMVKKDIEDFTNYSFTGGIGAISVTYNILTKKATVVTNEHDYDTYIVTVTNVSDLAGNAINPEQNFAEYEYFYIDTVSPELNSAELLTSTTLKLTFSEEISSDTAVNTNNYSIPGITVIGALKNTNEIVLITTEHSYGDYEITVARLEDLSGNVINPSANSIEYSRVYVDTTPPELLTATALDEDTVILTFSEYLNTSASDNPSNYSISGITISGAYTNWQFPNTVSLSTSTHSPGTYTVILTSGIIDESGNSISPSANSLEYEYTAQPELLTASGINANTVELKFSTHLEYYSATDISAYDISGPSTVTVKDATLTGPVVTLTTDQPTANGTYTVTATKVKDIYNNEIEAPYNTADYDYYADLTPPTVESAELLNTNTLKITFSEKLSIALSNNISKYKITEETASGVVQTLGVNVVDEYTYLTTGPHTYLTDYRVTVSGVGDLSGNIITTSGNYALYTFNVSGISANITSPAGGEQYYNGQYKPITWTLEEL